MSPASNQHASNPWEASPLHSGFITIKPNHHLDATISGPPRTLNQPLTIIIPGLSASASEWAAVFRLSIPFTRALLYDRSGYGLSSSSDQPTAISIAIELNNLLNAADLRGPFVIVCHSWGGIIAREFLHLRNQDIAGMVFVDANQELNTTDDPWPEPYIKALAQGLAWNEVTGIAGEHRLTKGEWAAYLEEEGSEKHACTAAAEFAAYRASGPTLALKEQLEADPPVLGDRPVSVLAGRTVRDFERVFEAGLKMGNGTEEERRLFREMLESYEVRDEGWQRETLKLSGKGRWAVAQESGHNVQFTEPEVIVGELRWILENLVP